MMILVFCLEALFGLHWREEGSGWGTLVCLWQIHFDIWQNQYNIVKFKNKIKFFKKGKKINKKEIKKILWYSSGEVNKINFCE